MKKIFLLFLFLFFLQFNLLKSYAFEISNENISDFIFTVPVRTCFDNFTIRKARATMGPLKNESFFVFKNKSFTPFKFYWGIADWEDYKDAKKSYKNAKDFRAFLDTLLIERVVLDSKGVHFARIPHEFDGKNLVILIRKARFKGNKDASCKEIYEPLFAPAVFRLNSLEPLLK